MTQSVPRRSVGGLITAHKHGAAHMAEIGRRGGQAALSVYGDSPMARRVRAQDLRAKRGMSDRQWRRLQIQRAHSFGIPLDRVLPANDPLLTSALVAQEITERSV